MKYRLIALGLAAFAVQHAQAIYLLESFEVSAFDPRPGKATARSTAWATHGDFSMRVTDSDGAWTWLHREYNDPLIYQAWLQNTNFLIDVHVAPRAAHNLNISIALNSARGWIQNDIVHWPWIGDNVGFTQTLNWDYSALRAGAPTTSAWFQLHLMGRTGSGHLPIDIHFDNARFVPEPMSMTALGLGAAALIWKRRRRK